LQRLVATDHPVLPVNTGTLRGMLLSSHRETPVGATRYGGWCKWRECFRIAPRKRSAPGSAGWEASQHRQDAPELDDWKDVS